MEGEIIDVIITPDLCKDTFYLNVFDCPLVRALNQQHPELNVTTCGGFHIQAGSPAHIGRLIDKWDERIMIEVKQGLHPKGYRVQIKLLK